MITTVDVKRDMFKVFRVGNPESKDVILVMGSCRVIAYLNYLDIYNRTVANNRFLIYCIDPFNFNWNTANDLIDGRVVIEALERDENLLKILASVKIFIHEYFENYGMFNVARDTAKNIYQFGMNPDIDVTIPNFHDVFILFGDFVKFPPFKGSAMDAESQSKIVEKAAENISKFLANCERTDIPEMKKFFIDHWRTCRLFWTFNHITRHFSLEVWRLLNEKFLHLPETDAFKAEISAIDPLAGTCTPITKYDVEHYRLEWVEPIA